MALYPYKCQGCGREETVHQSISSYSKAPVVPVCDCQATMVRVITAPMVVTDEIAPFRSTIDGSWITSKSQQRGHMSQHGVALLDDIAPEIERKKAEREKQVAVQRKQDVIASVHMAEAGHRPQIIPESEIIPK